MFYKFSHIRSGSRFESSLNGNSANDIVPSNNYLRQTGLYGGGGGMISNPYRGFGGGGVNSGVNSLSLTGLGGGGLSSPGGLGFTSSGLYNPIDRQYYDQGQGPSTYYVIP